MRLNKLFLVLGGTAFLVFLLAMLPARIIFLTLPEPVQAFGVEGSIWRGSARIIDTGGLQIRNTEWKIELSQLLLARVGGEFKTRWNGGFAEGNASLGLGGSLIVRDTRSAMDAAPLAQAVGAPPIAGQVSIELEELELQDMWPASLKGRGEIRNLSSSLMGQGAAAQIGNVAIEFTGEQNTDESIIGLIKDIGGPLEINGTLQLTPDRAYDLKTRVKARPGAPEQLRNNLQYLGSPADDGSHEFGLQGSV